MSKLEEAVRAIVREEIRNALVTPPGDRIWKKSDWELYRVVGMIPYGRVVSFTDVARMAGRRPARNHAQAVGQALGRLGYKCRHVPWWRVVQENGSPPGDKAWHRVRIPLMEMEGIKINDLGRVPEQFRWRPS
ncbi:MAG: MGMT family protein [bacterium]|nr:MGMT family protein [bacterium]